VRRRLEGAPGRRSPAAHRDATAGPSLPQPRPRRPARRSIGPGPSGISPRPGPGPFAGLDASRRPAARPPDGDVDPGPPGRGAAFRPARLIGGSALNSSFIEDRRFRVRVDELDPFSATTQFPRKDDESCARRVSDRITEDVTY